MQRLVLTLDTPAENLALDEALLDAAEAGEIAQGVLRVWEPAEYFVVLGRSSPVEKEVDLQACRRDAIAVLRRSSGGGTIVAGPGCLMFAVVLDYAAAPQLRAVDVAHRFVLGRIAAALAESALNVARAGISDLILPGAGSEANSLKFSGNALRCKRKHLLYHGTLLYDFDLDRIGRWLGLPHRQPKYRSNRGHTEFVRNIPLSRTALVETLVRCWNAHTELNTWPRERVARLVREKYERGPDWPRHTSLVRPTGD